MVTSRTSEPDDCYEAYDEAPVDGEQESLHALAADYEARFGRPAWEEDAAEDSLARFERSNPALVASANNTMRAAAARNQRDRELLARTRDARFAQARR